MSGEGEGLPYQIHIDMPDEDDGTSVWRHHMNCINETMFFVGEDRTRGVDVYHRYAVVDFLVETTVHSAKEI